MLFFCNPHHCSGQNNEKLIVFKQEVPLFTQIGGFIEENSLSWLNLSFPTEIQQCKVHNSHARWFFGKVQQFYVSPMVKWKNIWFCFCNVCKIPLEEFGNSDFESTQTSWSLLAYFSLLSFDFNVILMWVSSSAPPLHLSVLEQIMGGKVKCVKF